MNSLEHRASVSDGRTVVCCTQLIEICVFHVGYIWIGCISLSFCSRGDKTVFVDGFRKNYGTLIDVNRQSLRIIVDQHLESTLQIFIHFH